MSPTPCCSRKLLFLYRSLIEKGLWEPKDGQQPNGHGNSDDGQGNADLHVVGKAISAGAHDEQVGEMRERTGEAFPFK